MAVTMMSNEDMLQRIAALERTLEVYEIAATAKVKPVKRAVGKAATKAAKAAAKARRAQFRADAWHRSRLASTLSRYAI